MLTGILTSRKTTLAYLKTLPNACSSTLWFHQGSMEMTRLLAVRFKPCPPHFKLAMRTRRSDSGDSNFVFAECRALADISPVYYRLVSDILLVNVPCRSPEGS